MKYLLPITDMHGHPLHEGDFISVKYNNEKWRFIGQIELTSYLEFRAVGNGVSESLTCHKIELVAGAEYKDVLLPILGRHICKTKPQMEWQNDWIQVHLDRIIS